MEESLKAVYMVFAVFTFVAAMTILIALQKSFDVTYEKIVEVAGGGFVW